jgi:hypothetical protein
VSQRRELSTNSGVLKVQLRPPLPLQDFRLPDAAPSSCGCLRSLPAPEPSLAPSRQLAPSPAALGSGTEVTPCASASNAAGARDDVRDGAGTSLVWLRSGFCDPAAAWRCGDHRRHHPGAEHGAQLDTVNEPRPIVGDPSLDPELRARVDEASEVVPAVLAAVQRIRVDTDSEVDLYAISLYGTIIELFSGRSRSLVGASRPESRSSCVPNTRRSSISITWCRTRAITAGSNTPTSSRISRSCGAVRCATHF